MQTIETGLVDSCALPSAHDDLLSAHEEKQFTFLLLLSVVGVCLWLLSDPRISHWTGHQCEQKRFSEAKVRSLMTIGPKTCTEGSEDLKE